VNGEMSSYKILLDILLLLAFSASFIQILLNLFTDFPFMTKFLHIIISSFHAQLISQTFFHLDNFFIDCAEFWKVAAESPRLLAETFSTFSSRNHQAAGKAAKL
jgi:hypothetical protein